MVNILSASEALHAQSPDRLEELDFDTMARAKLVGEYGKVEQKKLRFLVAAARHALRQAFQNKIFYRASHALRQNILLIADLAMRGELGKMQLSMNADDSVSYAPTHPAGAPSAYTRSTSRVATRPTRNHCLEHPRSRNR